MSLTIQRRLLNELRNHLSRREITLITGARQAGKTTLMEALQQDLVRAGKPTLWLSLDFEEHQRFFSSQLALVQRLDLEFGRKPGFVFIDEIQRKENAGLFLKGIYDRKLPYKLIVSGSGSLELRAKIHESLAGRKKQFELATVSFEEFVHYKTEYKYEGRLRDFLRLEKDNARALLSEYLNFGGYPAVVLEPTIRGKSSAVNEIFRSYVEKDISYLLKVEKIQAFSDMIRILADQSGRILNHAELAATLALSLPTLKNYLWYAEKTYVLTRLTPFFTNKRKEITKSPVPYFHDLGLLNYAAGVFTGYADNRLGYLFQNLAFLLLRRMAEQANGSLHFWRTTDKAEVDFVLRLGKKTLPAEVKYGELKTPTVGRSLRSFIDKYSPDEAWIITSNYAQVLQVGKTELKFVPFHTLVEE